MRRFPVTAGPQRPRGYALPLEIQKYGLVLRVPLGDAGGTDPDSIHRGQSRGGELAARVVLWGLGGQEHLLLGASRLNLRMQGQHAHPHHRLLRHLQPPRFPICDEDRALSAAGQRQDCLLPSQAALGLPRGTARPHLRDEKAQSVAVWRERGRV
ncbi:unnamed protein product [Sphagnum balticum]